jgi:hypothetical protein
VPRQSGTDKKSASKQCLELADTSLSFVQSAQIKRSVDTIITSKKAKSSAETTKALRTYGK